MQFTAESDAGWSHLVGDFLAAIALDKGNVILALKCEPETRTVAEVVAEPDRGFGGNRAPAVQYVRDSPGRNPEGQGQPVGAQAAGLDLTSKQSAGMDNRRHGLILCDNRRSRR